MHCSDIVVAFVAATCLVSLRVAEADGVDEDATHLAAPRAFREGAAGLSAPRARTSSASPSVPRAVRRRPLEIHLAVETNAPTDAGGRVRVLVAQHLVFDVSSGLGVYGNVYADLARRFGAGDVAPVLAQLGNGARVVRGRIGVRPCRSCGLELMLGIGRLGTHASLVGPSLEALMGPDTGIDRLDLVIALRFLDVELGWVVPVGRHAFIRPSIGLLRTLHATMRVTLPETAPEPLMKGMTQTLEAGESALEQHGMCPTLSLGVGLRFR